jgi:hypothetical protein
MPRSWGHRGHNPPVGDIGNNDGENFIGCAVCLNITGKRVRAATVVKGYAVCEAHAKIAQEPKFELASFRGGQERRAV